LGDAWLNQAYPGFIDPTQVPMSPGDTERPMQPPPQMQQNNPPLPQMPQIELLQALQNALALKSQMQQNGQGSYTQNPNTEVRLPQQQSYQSASPALQAANTQIQPIVIPMVFDFTFNFKINLDVQQQG
jgi:hypothetical protein